MDAGVTYGTLACMIKTYDRVCKKIKSKELHVPPYETVYICAKESAPTLARLPLYLNRIIYYSNELCMHVNNPDKRHAIYSVFARAITIRCNGGTLK